MDLIQLLWWLTGVVALVVAGMLYIEDRRIRSRNSFIEELVLAADQYLEDNQERLQFVLQKLGERYPGLDPELARILIEAAVWRLKAVKRDLGQPISGELVHIMEQEGGAP